MSSTLFVNGMKTPKIYDTFVHPQIKEKLRLNESADLQQELDDANFLTQCFSYIKNQVLVNGTTPETTMDAIITNKVIQDLQKSDAFQYIGVSSHGVAFEQDLARMITDLLLASNGSDLIEEDINRVMTPMLTGTATASVNEQFTKHQAAALMGLTVKEFCNLTNEQVSSAFRKLDNGYYVLAGRSGKTDVDVSKGIGNVEFSFAPTDNYNRLIKILSTATFSAKNYLLDTIRKRGLKLGDTKERRYMASSLAFVGLSNNQIGELMRRTNAYEKGHKQGYDKIQQHLQHLRVAYELMGIGQSVGEAKFLVVNTRQMNGVTYNELLKQNQAPSFKSASSGDILVFSNRWLIGQMFNALLDDSLTFSNQGVFLH